MAPKKRDLGKKAASSNNEVNKAGSSKNKDIESNPEMQQTLDVEAAAKEFSLEQIHGLVDVATKTDDADVKRNCLALIQCYKNHYNLKEMATYMVRRTSLTPRTLVVMFEGALSRNDLGAQAYREYSTLQESIRSHGKEPSQEDRSIIKEVFAIRAKLYPDTTGQEQMESVENRSRAKEVQEDGVSLEAQEFNLKKKHTLEETAGIMSQMNISGKEEYQNISLDAARERNEHQDNHDDQLGPPMTATLPQILDTLKQLMISQDKLSDALGNQVKGVQVDMQRMSEKLSDALDDHGKRVQEGIQRMNEKLSDALDDQAKRVRGEMQRMSEKFTRSEEKFMTKNNLARELNKLERTMKNHVATIGPVIGSKVATDIEKSVSSAASATDLRKEVEKAMSQLEKHLISKIDQCISRENEKLQAVFVEQTASATDIRIKVEKAMSQLEKNLISKIDQFISRETQKLQAVFVEQTASAADIRIKVEEAMSQLEKHLISKIDQCISRETQKLRAVFVEQTASALSALSAAAHDVDQRDKGRRLRDFGSSSNKDGSGSLKEMEREEKDQLEELGFMF